MCYQIFFKVIIISFLFVVPGYSQISKGRNINLSIATTLNHHYLKKGDSTYGEAFHKLSSPPGYSIELGIDSVRIDWMRIDLAINFDQYQAKFKASYSGLPGGTTTEVDITKSVLGLTLYPIRIIKNNFRCQIGFEYSRLLNERFSGSQSTYLMGQNPIHIELKDSEMRFSTLSNVGIRIKAGYTYEISKQLYLSPYYSLYYSFTQEYPKAPAAIKSIRNSFGLTCLIPFN